MNIISKFSKFLNDLEELKNLKLNESVLTVLDVVIDSDGLVYNGEQADLVKGRVKIEANGVITQILGTNNINYPAGIDKNGNLVALATDDESRALVLNNDPNNPQPILIPNEIKTQYGIDHDYYSVGPEFDYQSLIPNKPTGWVNVKIDMELIKRVRRYAKHLGRKSAVGHESFMSKLLEFERLSTQTRLPQYISRLKRATIQKEMSVILLLQYINEVKDFFNPSQSGFLFESFIAGLMDSAKVKEDNSSVDINTPTDRYQLKLLDYKTPYVKAIKESGEWLEYYIIALKHVDKIDMYIIDGGVLTTRANNGNLGGLMTPYNRFIVQGLIKLNDDALVKKVTIELNGLEEKIKNIGNNLKQSLTEMYDELSKFQYNIETIITGVNENGKPVKNQEEFDVYHLSAERNILNLRDHLRNLVSDINK